MKPLALMSEGATLYGACRRSDECRELFDIQEAVEMGREELIEKNHCDPA